MNSIKQYCTSHKNNALWIYNVIFYFASIRKGFLKELTEIFKFASKILEVSPEPDNITYMDTIFAKILTLECFDLYDLDITNSVEELCVQYDADTIQHFISEDDIDGIKDFLSKPGFDINSAIIKYENSMISPLYFACLCGSITSFKFLLQNKAEFKNDILEYVGYGGNIDIFKEIESQITDYMPLIISSAKYHRYDLLNYSLKYLQKPDLSLIVDCITFMNIQMLVYLISNGLSFDNSHSNRYFPLHAAARTSLPELVMYIMDNSQIPVNQPDLSNDNTTALLESSIHGFTRVVVWLLEHGGDPHVLRKRDQMTPLHFAARNGDLKMMNALIEYKAKPMPISKKGKTPLHYAAEQGSKDMLLILTKNKPNLNVTPDGKETPLDIAVRKSDGNFVSALLARGIDPNPVHDKILPPLYVAVKENMEDIVAMLIMAGANVNSYTSDGKKLRTPLHAACSKGLVDLARFLIENGADKDAKDSDGKKPNEITKKKEIKQLFL